MDMRKFTEKSVAALQGAQSLAREYGNQEIGQTHLLYALTTAQDGLIVQLLQKMNKDANAVSAAALQEIKRLPKVSGGEQYISRALAEAIENAETQAEQMGDSYLSVEHLFYGLTEKADGTVKEIFKASNAKDNCRLVVTPKDHWWCEDIVWSSINEECRKLGWK